MGDKLKEKEFEANRRRLEALARYVEARAKYLRATGWVAGPVAVPGAPVWWRSPYPDDEGREFREDNAAAHQELRDNDLPKYTAVA